MSGGGVSFLSKRFFLFLGLGVGVFLALTLYGNWGEVRGAFRTFSYKTLPLILGLAFMNYVVRFWRWQLYLKKLEIRLPAKESFYIFMSGLVMTVTPGKMGEVLKSYLLKEGRQVPLARSAPIILAERFTDLLAVYLLTMLGGISFAFGARILWLGMFVLILGLLPFISPGIFHGCVRILEKRSWGKRVAGPLTEAFHTLHDLMGFRLLLIASILGMMAWFFECLAFQTVFWGLGAHIPLIKATFIYAFSTLAGALSMLPGGIGAAEGSMTSLLVLMQIPKALATTATIIIRLGTVWFAVLLGYCFLKLYQREHP
ncbi:MAG TPA: lysylphosphatidylglycerol synthase transmembrane domain-containing protein [Thermodesulfobacteriota bacterium]|nr:lysylphosphatidylglycerol synthase transmembrane domain-containing protein [Thermodesulfobacteriota bacterium]